MQQRECHKTVDFQKRHDCGKSAKVARCRGPRSEKSALSTLLVELDGVDSDDRSVDHGGMAVVGITANAAWIDPRLKRPGRLAVRVHGRF